MGFRAGDTPNDACPVTSSGLSQGPQHPPTALEVTLRSAGGEAPPLWSSRGSRSPPSLCPHNADTEAPRRFVSAFPPHMGTVTLAALPLSAAYTHIMGRGRKRSQSPPPPRSPPQSHTPPAPPAPRGPTLGTPPESTVPFTGTLPARRGGGGLEGGLF